MIFLKTKKTVIISPCPASTRKQGFFYLYLDDLVGAWANGQLIFNADGTGYQSPMGYILGELQYPDDIVWCATDNEL